MKNLSVDLETFGFVERESKNGRKVKNKCGRDFLYYALNYYYPDKFNSAINNPVIIDRNRIFGLPVKENLSWAMIQFYKVPKLFQSLGLDFSINGRKIKSFPCFLLSIIKPTDKLAEEAIGEIEKIIDSNSVAGVDISIYGLINHVIFVYGYDHENFYVFETQQIPILEYEKITQDNKYIMRLPKDIIKKRWTMFGRVWFIKRK
jgi:hypothetical protein